VLNLDRAGTKKAWNGNQNILVILLVLIARQYLFGAAGI
jgi:hypothetical protein